MLLPSCFFPSCRVSAAPHLSQMKTQVAEPEACDQMYESLARLHSNYYKHKYPRPRDTSFSGLSLEEYKLILSTACAGPARQDSNPCSTSQLCKLSKLLHCLLPQFPHLKMRQACVEQAKFCDGPSGPVGCTADSAGPFLCPRMEQGNEQHTLL
ncbi:PREDICTED: uncharacterized protein LOC105593232 isoform X2 [Cercocebus atys]|uniref:uncharacterized protein LOC105593232 isoform X2 n=1 Tax=Cercocebus atys TaxID=9531 RepID=UPI0005F438E4|nr:PREDICTED: uncharacterized protein LOC105593232 isoform X2 [Cercocebus atys]